jgi:glycosyltransferase involved in cell wall biosynthesis
MSLVQTSNFGVSAYSKGRSAIYTPYHLTPGGGERVLLCFLRKFQDLNGNGVDMVVRSDNICKKKTCLKALAKRLDVDGISWNYVKVKLLNDVRPGYNIWFSMGNSLFPEVESYGLYSIYHCQFPFNGLDYSSTGGFQRLKSYSIVYLNSQYTYTWYTRYLNTFRAQIQPTSRRGRHLTLPLVLHFPPPFNLHGIRETDYEVRTTAANSYSRVNIILLGRFFAGAQSKNHELAITAFEKLQSHLRERDLRLTLVGHVAKGNEAYFKKINRLAKKNKQVSIIKDADATVLENLIRASDVVWSITGMPGLNVQARQDAADAEHFGLGLLECMSAGLIPVAVDRGGPKEILLGLPDFLRVNSVTELAESTAELLALPEREILELRQRSRIRARELQLSFEEGSSAMFTTLGKTLSPSIRDTWFTVNKRIKEHERMFALEPPVEELSSCPPVWADTRAVLYVEERIDTSLRAVASILSDKLGKDWRLHVWHSDTNALSVRSSLEGFDCVVYHNLRDVKSSDKALTPRDAGEYQRIWKSQEFFEALGPKVEHVLTFQSDTWFPPRGRFQEKWLADDFIGPPWCHEGNWGYLDPNDRPPESVQMLHDTRKIPYGMRVGNGGVSIRSVPAMKSVLRSHLQDSAAQENEDVFYVIFLTKDNFRVANLSDAVNFGLEILCEDVHEHTMLTRDFRSASFVPFALHKPFDIMQRLGVKHAVDFRAIVKALF